MFLSQQYLSHAFHLIEEHVENALCTHQTIVPDNRTEEFWFFLTFANTILSQVIFEKPKKSHSMQHRWWK